MNSAVISEGCSPRRVSTPSSSIRREKSSGVGQLILLDERADGGTRQHGEHLARLEELQGGEDRGRLDQAHRTAQALIGERGLEQLAARRRQRLDDPGPVHQLRQRQRLFAEQGVTRIDHDAHPRRADVVEFEPVVLALAGKPADDDVEGLFLQFFQEQVARPLQHPDRHPRMARIIRTMQGEIRWATP